MLYAKFFVIADLSKSLSDRIILECIKTNLYNMKTQILDAGFVKKEATSSMPL